MKKKKIGCKYQIKLNILDKSFEQKLIKAAASPFILLVYNHIALIIVMVVVWHIHSSAQ